MVPTLLLVAGLFAVLLLAVLQARTAQRLANVQAAMDRLQVVQRDMTADVRSRLEDGASAWASIDGDLRPRLDALEAAVADLSAALEEHLPALGAARSRLASAEERLAELEAELRQTMGARTGEIDARFDQVAEEVRALRIAHEERVANVAARILELERARRAPPPPSPAGASEPASEPGALAAVEAAAGAPATFGTPRGRKGARGRSGRRWLFVAVVLVLGLVGVVVLS